MRNTIRGLFIVAGCWALQANAAPSGSELPYFGAQYLFEIPDSARDSDNGDGYQLSFGVPNVWGKMAGEITLSDLGRKRDLDGKKDYQTTLMFDLVRDFGTYGWDNGLSFTPFGLAGIGAVQEDVRGDKHVHLGGNLGLGLLFPTSFHNLAIRTEVRGLLHDNSGESVAGEDLLTDYRITLGLQLPLWFLGEDDTLPPPATDCGVRVVEANAVTREDCGPDSDGDGVADSADRCPGTPAGTLVDARGCPMTDGFVLRNVNFELDSAILTNDSRLILDNVATTLNSPANKNIAVQIGGHTDVIGTEAYNLMLSQQRAESVRQYLIGKGVDGSRLKAEGFGTSQPVASNDTEEGRAENRRVEFKISIQ